MKPIQSTILQQQYRVAVVLWQAQHDPNGSGSQGRPYTASGGTTTSGSDASSGSSGIEGVLAFAPSTAMAVVDPSKTCGDNAISLLAWLARQEFRIAPLQASVVSC